MALLKSRGLSNEATNDSDSPSDCPRRWSSSGSLGGAFAQTQRRYAPSGMMRGRAYGPGMMLGWGTASTISQGQPIHSLDEARQAFQRYVDVSDARNPELNEVLECEWNYDAIVNETSTGQGAFELLANPQNGVVFPEMGPNMMWNAQYSPRAAYGMMGGFGRRPSG